MTGGPANIDSWFEFLVWLVIAGAALLGAVQSWRGRREHARPVGDHRGGAGPGVEYAHYEPAGRAR